MRLMVPRISCHQVWWGEREGWEREEARGGRVPSTRPFSVCDLLMSPINVRWITFYENNGSPNFMSPGMIGGRRGRRGRRRGGKRERENKRKRERS
jgi:hypothetical protein